MPPSSTVDSDPFYLDADQLQALASAAVVRRGIAYFKEDRVTGLTWDDHRVRASVQGSQTRPHEVEIALDEDGELAVDCDCPFDWEPACKHAIATLLAYGARQPVAPRQLTGAVDAAVDTRVRRGRSEVAVKHVAGDRWMGTWEARSLTTAQPRSEPWRVELRSLSEKLNHCTCPDFAINRLGTCKHIEAVLHALRKRAPKKFARLASSGPPTSLVHVDWQAAEAPRLRLRRADDGGPEWLDRFFDGDGVLQGPLPEAFASLQQQARRRSGLVITGEAARYVERFAADRTRRQRAAELAARLRASGGELPGVTARLYPYQVEGVAFLATAGRAMLADDMGLGKTLQAIAAAAVMREHAGVERSVVICPASLKHQWAREVHRFTGLDAVVIEGPPTARLALYRRRAPFTLVNYEVVLRDRDTIQAELAPDLLILDEAQRIKNWRTQTAAAVKSLRTTYAFVLTGTPLENRLEDLYSLLQVVDARVLGPLWRYLLDFHVTDGRGRVLGYRNLSELRRRLAPVMLRRDKSLVRDQLPDRLVHRLDVELDRRQRALHDEAVAAAGSIAQVLQKRPLTPLEEQRFMAALQRARMACNAAGLVDGKSQGSPKLDELRTLLEQLCIDAGHKVVVFSQWERMTRMAEDVAHALRLGSVRLHGGVPSARRRQLIDRFRDDPSVQVFLSTDAGGVGLNLQTASVLINLDLPWNPAVLEQRIGRVHRLGQREAVQVVLMVARKSYEEHIAGLIDSKRELFRHAVTAEGEADVIGVSKRMIETALAGLDDERTAATDDEDTIAATAADDATEMPGEDEEELAVAAMSGPEIVLAEPQTAAVEEDSDASLAPLIGRLQQLLGDGLQRIVAVDGFLIGVVDTLDAQLEERAQAEAEACAADVPVALIEARSWAAMSRLPSMSSFAAGRTLLEASAPGAAGDHLSTQAQRKLAAAQALADQGHASESLSLATAAMILAIAAAVGLPQPPASDNVAVWLHAELVPEGRVDLQTAANLSRALALGNAADVPPDLLGEILRDATAVLLLSSSPS